MSVIERRPFMLDTQLYPIVDSLDRTGQLELRFLRRNQFPKWAIVSKFNRWFLNHPHFGTGWKCFVTGVQCYLLETDLALKLSPRDYSWACSLEHLVASRMREFHADGNKLATNSILSHTVVGNALNHNLGHAPLAVKLLHRKMFKQIVFCHNDPSRETYLAAKKQIIATEDGLMFHGKYPWQPWTYTDPVQQQSARLLYNELIQHQEEFFRIPARERPAWFDAFEWRW